MVGGSCVYIMPYDLWMLDLGFVVLIVACLPARAHEAGLVFGSLVMF